MFTLVFSSPEFIFFFLPAVLLLYFLVPKKLLFARNFVLLLFSLFFYYYGERIFIVVMLFSVAINYIFGLIVHFLKNKGKNAKFILTLSVITNLGVLFYFKYLNFFVNNINSFAGTQIILEKIIMPIGVSFFTFQAMSYVFDVYMNKGSVQKNPLNLALYISMFPQLIAGPIVRYETVAAELKCRKTDSEKVAGGIIRFIYGLSKKILLANSMGFIADKVFAVPLDKLNADLAWIGAIAYSLQIYFDFSGYSCMAIGLGKIFGFTFLENFNYPYISKSITEFWRRWHISLGTWFRDYVYIPLGGNRKGNFRHTVNIFVVWLLTGFWHGAAWNFIFWGLYFALLLIVEKFFLLKLLSKLPGFIAHIYSLLMIILGWVLFRSDNIGNAFTYMTKMFTAFEFTPQAYYFIIQYRTEFLAAVLFSLPLGQVLSRIHIKNKLIQFGFLSLKLIFIFTLFFLSVVHLINSSFNPFIYFRF